MSLQDLRDRVITDGKVDPDEVAEIRGEVYDDDLIDTSEATMLFEINNAVTGNPDNDPAWADLFVEAITSYVLQDEDTPGNVDDAEANFLIAQIGADNDIDDLEERLLLNIEDAASSVSIVLLDYLDDNGL